MKTVVLCKGPFGCLELGRDRRKYLLAGGMTCSKRTHLPSYIIVQLMCHANIKHFVRDPGLVQCLQSVQTGTLGERFAFGDPGQKDVTS